MVKLKKRIVKWGLSAAKVGLAASVLMGSAGLSQTDEFEGFDGLDFGAIVQRGLERSSKIWFGVDRPLKESAPPTSGPYRTVAQRASDQVLLADGLKDEYVIRTAGNAADMFAFWPSDSHPTHLIFCIEGGRQDLGTFLPGGLVKKFNTAVQRIKLSEGSVETILRGTIACDGIRCTAWQTILATEEASDGGAYEIINPFVQGSPYDLTACVLTAVGRVLRIPVLLWTHGLHGDESGVNWWVRAWLYRLSRGLPLYDQHAKHLLIAKGVAADHLHVIYNSLDDRKQAAVAEDIRNGPTVWRSCCSAHFSPSAEESGSGWRRTIWTGKSTRWNNSPVRCERFP